MFLCTPPLDSVRDLNFRLAIQTTDKRTDVWSRDFMIYKPCPFDYGLKKFALDPVVVFFSKDVKKSTSVGSSIGWSSCCNFFWNALDPTFVIFLKMTGSSLFISLNGQGWKINSGLWAVVWAGLWEKRGWADYEHLFENIVASAQKSCIEKSGGFFQKNHFFRAKNATVST